MRNGIHTLKDGNDIISLKGSTTATRVALLPGDQQAYLYGNDNFTLADIHDGSFDNNHPAFLHNRAKPFAGGLTLVRIAPDGTVFGGGRIKTNDFNIVASFSPRASSCKPTAATSRRTRIPSTTWWTWRYWTITWWSLTASH